MSMEKKITSVKVLTPEERDECIAVLDEVYLKEKNWINSSEQVIPKDLEHNTKQSWFLVKVNHEPAGVLRLEYDPCLNFPPELKVTLKDHIDVEELKKSGRFVDIGRFAILPKYRRNIMVALRLMRSAIKEVVERDYTHFITDVFENEPTSPLKFHTRILGFEVIGSHIHGELNCSCTRIILTMDIIKAYEKLKQRGAKISETLTLGFSHLLEKKIKV
ncbi:MAG: hypothetical protein JXR70_09235 [Spirochaetales bacterium]|nr:hypothetical protein [Spirochaetales bacterium]